MNCLLCAKPIEVGHVFVCRSCWWTRLNGKDRMECSNLARSGGEKAVETKILSIVNRIKSPPAAVRVIPPPLS